MTVLFHFLDRLQDHYLWLLGLLLMIEPVLDYNIERYKDWADQYVSRRFRTRVAVVLSVFALFTASFLAFRDEYIATQSAESKVAQVSGERDEARRERDTNVSPALNRMSGDLLAARGQIDVQSEQINKQQTEINSQEKELDAAKKGLANVEIRYARRHLSPEEKSDIQRVAKSADGENNSIAVYQPSDCYDCNEYSTEFIEALTAPGIGWKVSIFTTMHGGVNPHFRGIAILVKDTKNPSKAALLLATALSAAKIPFIGGPDTGFNVPEDGVGLLIGPKKTDD